MAKFVSPLLGYNNNVRHKNRVFHIQTEDSGVNHPHIITHLFMDGGRILKSVKKSYAEHVGAEGMSEIVRQMMKEQHKAMFIALRDGQFDHLVDPTTNSAPPKEKQAAPAPAPAVEAKPALDAAASSIAQSPPPAPAVAAAPRLAVAEREIEDVPATTRQPEPPAGVPPLTLDLASLDPAPADTASLFQASDLPPPPKNLFPKERGTGVYHTAEPEPEPAGRPGPKPAPAAAKSPAPPRASGSRPPQSSRPGAGDAARYAPARPAAIFGSSAKPQTQSIFSDDLVSDKSLDEVILSYLAEDLEPPRRK